MSQEAMQDDFVLPIGKAKVERTGSDITIVAHSIYVGRSLEAADKLAEEGIKAEVINLRSIRPLDIKTIIESVKKTNRYVYKWIMGGRMTDKLVQTGDRRRRLPSVWCWK